MPSNLAGTEPHFLCPWCRKRWSVKRDKDGRWWHRLKTYRIYCLASKIREKQ